MNVKKGTFLKVYTLIFIALKLQIMSFNSFQSPFPSKTHLNYNEPNLITNPMHHYQSTVPKAQTIKTLEFQPQQFTLPSSINNSFLNVRSKFPTSKFTTTQLNQKLENLKNININTAKSMVFMSSQKDSSSPNLPKNPFTGLEKLSSMARTAEKNFDDSDDFQQNKNLKSKQNSPKFREEKPTTFEKYGNTLGQQLKNSKESFQKKQPSAGSSLFFSVGHEGNSVFKSFVKSGSNNFTGSESKKPGGLDFLLKYKKEQQQKKQKETERVRFGEDKTLEHSKMNDNGNRNFLNPSDSGHARLFHEYSAPDLGHIPKNHTYEPVKIPLANRNEPYSKSPYSQYDSPIQGNNSQLPHNFSTSNNGKYSPPQQQGSNPTFLSKYNTDKTDNRLNFVKTFASESNLGQNSQEIGSFSPSLVFAKKQKKVDEELVSHTTPDKEKFVAPSFFKNKPTKLFSQAKTVETIPSPSSPKVNEFYDQTESPKQIKSTLSDDDSVDSIEYMNENFDSEVKEWCLDNFELGDKLGKGAFGDVFLARQKSLGFMCVLKKMSKKRIKEMKREEHVIRELKIQMYLSHRHLTTIYGYFHDRDYIYLILQYLPDGNLSQIKKRKKTSQSQTANILKQVCEGLMFMHQHSIIHRDIKPQNIFCNDGYMKLGDFGCSVCTDGMRKTVVSCLEYSSPQQLNGGAYNEKIDIWGIGVLAYELLTGRSPYEKEIMSMAEGQVDFSQLKFPQQLKLSELSKDFIRSLLNVDPIDRLNIHEALEHKFITSNSDESIHSS